MLDTTDTQNFDEMNQQAIRLIALDDTTYLVLRVWNKATPFVIHYWTAEMGYFWGTYLATSDVEEAKKEYYKKLKSIL
jgi:hypothetical protein